MLAGLSTLARAFWGVCTFRLGPQDIPPSSVLLAATALINLFVSTLINRLQLDFGAAVMIAAVEFAVLTGLTAALLFGFSRTQRLLQTLSALMGSGAVLGVIVLVLLLVFAALPWFLRLGIFVWNLAVMAHILRHALSIHIAAAFFIAVGYAIFLVQLVIFLDRMLAAPVA